MSSAAHKEIMAAIPDDFARRMRNWARNICGSSLGYAQARLDEVHVSGFREAGMPTLSGEASDTADALATLEARYRRAVELFWVWEDAELSTLARRCGGIEYRTYAKRVMDGHALLQSELSRRADAWRNVRRRNEVRVVGIVRVA